MTTKIITLNILPKLSNNAVIIIFIAILREMNLSGLNTLNSLRILIIGRLKLGKHKSINEVTAIRKSVTFHDSLKYDP